MTIHIYHSYFRYPGEGGGIRSYHLAKKLIDEGHNVTVITAHNLLSGRILIDGIPVKYYRIPYSNNFGFSRRIFSFLSFLVLAIWHCLTRRSDFNYIISTPLTNGLIGLVSKQLTRTPYIFEVGDLWPAVPIKLGVIRSRWLQKLLRWLERLCYVHARQIVALSPPMAEAIRRSQLVTEVICVPNFSDCDFFQPHYRIQKITKALPLVVSYIGTLGIANGLEALIQLAREAEDRKLPVQINIMGDGKEKTSLEAQAASLSLPNVRFLPFGNYQQVRELIRKTDVIYLSFLPMEVLHTGSPNKLFDGLAAGKAILSNFSGWIGALMEAHRCGFCYAGDQPQEAVDLLVKMINDPDLLSECQQHARQLAETQFDKDTLLTQWISAVN